jgi:hypothetical protein
VTPGTLETTVPGTMTRPTGLPHWIGDTVYLKHTEMAGTVVAVIFEGDRTYPVVRYDVRWADEEFGRQEHYAVEISDEKNFTT